MASGDGKIPDLPRGLIDRRGTPAGKASRLPSLRGPRDLTLGGVPKRVFAPNIPVRREKPSTSKEESKDQTEGKAHDSKSRERLPRGRGQGSEGGRGRGRGRNDNIIQTHSLFEQGPSIQSNKGRGSSRDDGGDGSPGGSRKGSRVSAAPRVKLENPDHVAATNNLLRDNFIADGPEEDLNLLPVTIPMREPVKMEIKKASQDQTMDGTAIKGEINNEVDGPSVASDISQGGHFSTSTNPVMISCAELLRNAVKSGVPVSEETTPPTGAASKADVNDNDKKSEKKPIRCSLGDFSEGYLGKLRVRKSGKTELVLGNLVLDVSMSVPSSFLQEVVSVRTGEDDKHMTMLGHVKQKLIITPDFETLLKTKTLEKT